MGFIATIKNVFASNRNGTAVREYTVDGGGDDSITVDGYGTPGDDSPALPSDLIHCADGTGEGRANAAGFIDPGNELLAAPGERRLYSRDSAGGKKTQVWLKGDGSILIDTDANVTINNATIDPEGNIVSPGTITADNIIGNLSVKAAGKEVVGHDHDILSGSSSPGPTGPNN